MVANSNEIKMGKIRANDADTLVTSSRLLRYKELTSGQKVGFFAANILDTVGYIKTSGSMDNLLLAAILDKFFKRTEELMAPHSSTIRHVESEYRRRVAANAYTSSITRTTRFLNDYERCFHLQRAADEMPLVYPDNLNDWEENFLKHLNEMSCMIAALFEFSWQRKSYFLMCSLLPLMENIYRYCSGENGAISWINCLFENNVESLELALNNIYAQATPYIQENSKKIFGVTGVELETKIESYMQLFLAEYFGLLLKRNLDTPALRIWGLSRKYLFQSGGRDDFKIDFFTQALDEAIRKPYIECWYRICHKKHAISFLREVNITKQNNGLSSCEKYDAVRSLTLKFILVLKADRSTHLLPELTPFFDYFLNIKPEFRDKTYFFRRQKYTNLSLLWRIFSKDDSKHLTEEDWLNLEKQKSELINNTPFNLALR